MIYVYFWGFKQLLGLACLGVGIWFHASADINAYLTVFVKSENDGIILACAAILLSAGLSVESAIDQIHQTLTSPSFWYHAKVESLDHITARRESLGFVEFQRAANSRGVA